jgi:hyaluronoglucosaminidase
LSKPPPAGACTTKARGSQPFYAGRDFAGTQARRALWPLRTGRGAVVPVDTATGRTGRPLPAGVGPVALALTPDGRTLFVADANAVVPLNLATGKLGTPIRVGDAPCALAVTPDGRTLYAANLGLSTARRTVTPVDLATGKPAAAIKVGRDPQALAVTPDGHTLYAVAYDGTVTPVNIATGTPAPPIRVPRPYFAQGGSVALALTPSGRTLYVANEIDDTVSAIHLKR